MLQRATVDPLNALMILRLQQKILNPFYNTIAFWHNAMDRFRAVSHAADTIPWSI